MATPRRTGTLRRGTPRKGSPQSGTPHVETTPRRPRRRSALKNYYGIGDKGVEEKDPSDMDSTAFEVDPFFDALLREKHMKQLVRERASLQHSIKKLDNGMKTLVYENYNKFISATDTIRVMKSNVDNMKEEMNNLAENIEDIRKSTEGINDSLKPSHTKVVELGGIYKLLNKTHFLTSLPQRLRQAIEMNAYSQAVHEFTTNLWILKEYSHFSSFQSILNECNEVMDELKGRLQDELSDDTIPLPQMAKHIKLLLSLNGSAEKMMTEFVSRQGSAVMKLLSALLEKCAALERGEPLDVDPLPSSKESVDDSLVEQTSRSTGNPGADAEQNGGDDSDDSGESNVDMDGDAANSDSDATAKKDDDEAPFDQFGRDFSPPDAPASSPPWLMLLKNGLADLQPAYVQFLQNFRDCFVYNIDLGREQRKRAQETFDSFSKDFFHRYAELCCRLLALCGEPSHLILGLATVNEEAALLTKTVPDILSVVDFRSEITTRAVQQHIDETYDQLECSVVARLKELIEPATEEGEELLAEYVRGFVEHPADRGDTGPDSRSKFTAAAIVKDVVLFFNGVEPLLTEHSSPVLGFLEGYASMCFTQLTVRIQKCVLCIVEALNEVYDELKTTDVALSIRASQRPPCLLELARLALHFRVWAVDRVNNALTHLGEMANCDDMGGINPPALKETFETSSDGLLSYYVKLSSHRLSAVVFTAFDAPDWRTVPDPSGVSEAAQKIVEDISELRKQVCAVFEPTSRRRIQVDGKRPSSRPGSARVSRMPRSARSLRELKAGFSFDTAITIFGDVSADAPSIIACIVRAFFKCYLEYVRLQTFSAKGFQQIQVDMHFVGLVLRKFMADESLFERMRRDVLASAKARTVDESPELESTVVSSLCDPALASPNVLSCGVPSMRE